MKTQLMKNVLEHVSLPVLMNLLKECLTNIIHILNRVVLTYQVERLCIARALLKKPKILILDDSTSAVDTVTDAKIRKAFREEIPDTTKIIIAQRISSVKDTDRIIVFDDGKIDGVGTHEELLKNNSIYREVYNQQMNDNADFDKKGGEQ